MNTNKNMTNHMTVKLLKNRRYRKKTRKSITYKETMIQMVGDFSSQTNQKTEQCI